MTTSLSNTSPNELFPGATTPTAGAATLADGLAALLAAPSGAVTASGANAPLPAEFSSLLDSGVQPASTDVAPATTASRPATAINPTMPDTNAAVRANAPQSTVVPTTVSAGSAMPMPTDARGLALKPTRSAAAVPAGKREVVENAVEAKTGATLPDRTTLEAIVALLAPVAVALDSAPVAGAPVVGGEGSAPETLPLASGESHASTEISETLPALASASALTPARSRGQVTVTLPGQPAVVFDENLAPTPGSARAAAETREQVPARPVATNSASVSIPTDPITPRTASRTELPQAATAPLAAPVAKVSSIIAQPAVASSSPAVEFSATQADEQPALPVIEATAEVELSDGAVVALALPSKLSAPVATAASAEAPAVSAARPEKSAALPRAEILPEVTTEKRAGKNFLTADRQGPSSGSTEAGIGVAQTHPTMLFTPHDTLPTVASTVPALVSMVDAAPQAAGAPAAEPMPQLVAASVARRAVEAVTSVVDAQAASKLQPVPSVQLKFKIGHEDLAVRVALRDGVVHTEFRTDSPELRAALQQEWKAVTAQPESALRFLEPVVSAASSTQSGTNSFAQQQQQHSPGQSAAQQQQQQQHQQARAAAEFFGSVARSTPFQPRDGGAVANVAAAVLPTSLHLSAVA